MDSFFYFLCSTKILEIFGHVFTKMRQDIVFLELVNFEAKYDAIWVFQVHEITLRPKWAKTKIFLQKFIFPYRDSVYEISSNLAHFWGFCGKFSIFIKLRVLWGPKIKTAVTQPFMGKIGWNFFGWFSSPIGFIWNLKKKNSGLVLVCLIQSYPPKYFMTYVSNIPWLGGGIIAGTSGNPGISEALRVSGGVGISSISASRPFSIALISSKSNWKSPFLSYLAQKISISASEKFNLGESNRKWK